MWFCTMSRKGPLLPKMCRAIQCRYLLHGDLDMVDVAIVPERFKKGVGKAENQNILYGFFAEVVVDPVDLLFV